MLLTMRLTVRFISTMRFLARALASLAFLTRTALTSARYILLLLFGITGTSPDTVTNASVCDGTTVFIVILDIVVVLDDRTIEVTRLKVADLQKKISHIHAYISDQIR
jgi:hypothetical protein